MPQEKPRPDRPSKLDEFYQLMRAGRELGARQAQQRRERLTEPVTHPVRPDTPGEKWPRESPSARHPLDAMYSDSVYAALGRDRSVKVRPGGGRRDSLTAFQNKYRAAPEVTEELYDTAREVGIEPELAFGMAHEETDFIPSRVSSANARGVLQIRDIAGEELGYDADELAGGRTRASLEYAKREIDAAGSLEEGLGWYNQGRKGYREDGPTDYAQRVMGTARQKPK